MEPWVAWRPPLKKRIHRPSFAGLQNSSAWALLSLSWKRHVKVSAPACNSLFCHEPARQLRKGTLCRFKRRSITINFSQSFAVFYWEDDICMVKSWNYGGLQKCGNNQLLIFNAQDTIIRRSSRIATSNHPNFILGGSFAINLIGKT